MQLIALQTQKLDLWPRTLMLLYAICNLLQLADCASVPFDYYDFPNIQAGIVSMTQITPIDSITSRRTCVYNFKKPKRVTPDIDWVFTAIYQMDYAANDPRGFSQYLISLTIYHAVVGTTGIKISVDYKHNMLNTIKMMTLIIDNDFAYKDIFQIEYYRISNGSSSSTPPILSTTIKSSNVAIMTYLYRFEMVSSSLSATVLGCNLEGDTTNFLTYTLSVKFYGSHVSRMASFKVLMIYLGVAKSYEINIQTYGLQYTPGLSTFSLDFDYYMPEKSVYLIGLSRFQYQTANDPSDPGIVWNISLSSNSTKQAIFTYSLDPQIKQINVRAFMINRVYCPSPFYLHGTNRSTLSPQCFDSCYENQYILYDSATKAHKCIPCPNSLCKTCQIPIRCSSCVPFYDLNPTTFLCVLNTAYSIDASSNIQLCNVPLPGCKNCSSTTVCTKCFDGFYLDLSICQHCSSLTLHCSNCTLTECFACVSPKVLVNGSLCSDPIPSQPIPGPDGPLPPCNSQHCALCSATNDSYCEVCKIKPVKLSNGQCSSACGDGLIFDTDLCDDGNQIDYDGCSSDCQTIENGFVCNTVPSLMTGFNMSECYFNKTITLTVTSIEKPLTENKVNLYFKNPEPKINAWQDIETQNQLTQAFTLKIPRFDSGVPGYFFNYTASFVKSPELLSKLQVRAKNLSPEDLYSQRFLARRLQSSTTLLPFSQEQYEFILLEITYSPDAPGSFSQLEISKESLNQQILALSFNPKLSQRPIFTKSGLPMLFTSSFSLKADDNQVIQFYDESYYQKVDQIGFLSMVIGLSCILLMVIGLFSFCVDGRNSKQMLVAVETSFIVQLSYFSFLGLGEINPMFLSMASGLKYSVGYDLMTAQEGSQEFRQLSGMGVGSLETSSNVNLSLILVLLCQIVGGLLLVFDRFCKKQALSEIKNQESQIDSLAQQKIKEDETVKDTSLNAEESEFKKMGKFLVFNAGFGLFIFFLYKFLFFSLVQMNLKASSLTALDIIVTAIPIIILLFYSICLIRKLDWSKSFTEELKGRKLKINIMETMAKNKVIDNDKIKRIEKRFLEYLESLPEEQKPEVMRSVELAATNINIKLWYLMIILVEHITNMTLGVFLAEWIPFNRLFVILLYLVQLLFVCKFTPYQLSSLYRLYFTYFIGLLIQIILFVRSAIIQQGQIVNEIGRVETQLGVYFPFTIVISLLLVCIIAFIYSVYGIRKTRCCKLETDWQKIGMDEIMKSKLQRLIMEELDHKDQLFNPVVLSKNPLQIGHRTLAEQTSKQIQQGSINPLIDRKEQQNNHLSNDGPQQAPIVNFPNLLLQQTSPKKHHDNHSSIGSISSKVIKTTDLKREIKEKLLNRKIDNKMKTYRRNKKSTNEQAFFALISEQKQREASQMLRSNAQQVKSEAGKFIQGKDQAKTQGKVQARNTENGKKITEMNDRNSEARSKQFEQEIGYIYTNEKKYNTLEEYDLI